MLKNRRGFTIIELLVVIGIIAVLAAILFPIFSAVKDKGRENTCLNNLKQLGKGIRLYADEWTDRLPTARLETGGYGNPKGNWAGVYDVHGKCDPKQGQIFRYVRDSGIYLCPSDRGVNPRMITVPGALPYPLSYSMNNIADYRTSSTMTAYASKVGLLLQEDRNSINDGDFYWYGWKDGKEGMDNPSQVHHGGTCILYCDMHSRWQKYENVIKAFRNGEWDPLVVKR